MVIRFNEDTRPNSMEHASVAINLNINMLRIPIKCGGNLEIFRNAKSTIIGLIISATK